MPDQGVTLNARIQYKKDTDANWTSNNPVLLENELIIVEMENGDCRFKIGDGIHTYSDLPFTDQLLRDEVESKISKEEGKALSSNDFTDDLKNKLDGISIMKGATADADGTSGLVPPPAQGADSKFLRGDGAWAALNIPAPDRHDTTYLLENTDLNTFIDPGWYYTGSNAVALTLLNCPTTNAFTLVVTKHAGFNQMLIEYMTSGYKIYTRNYYNGVWGAWSRVYTEIDKPSVSWADVSSKPSTFPPSGHTHFYLEPEGDNRNYATTPNDYHNSFAFRGIKEQRVINTPVGSYAYLMGLRGWSDDSGGDSHELAFTNAGVYHRMGATTSWGSWAQLYTSRDIIPLVNGGLGATSAQGARTNLGFSGSPMYALWSGNNNLTSQLTLSGLGANPGYNTFIFIFAEGYAGYRVPIAIPFSIIPSSKSLIFEVGSGSTGAFSRFYVWKDASNLYLQQYGYIGSGGSLRTVYGRY